jgi:hypothetical protein
MQMTGSVPSVSSTFSFEGRLNLIERIQEPSRASDPTTPPPIHSLTLSRRSEWADPDVTPFRSGFRVVRPMAHDG